LLFHNQNVPDLHSNFAYSTVLTAPSPASSGTSLTVQSGNGALFPTPPFNAAVWPTGVIPVASNAEIVRVTNISGDTFTITRNQESSNNRSIIVGDQIAATITKKSFTDIETLFTDTMIWNGPPSGAPVYLPFAIDKTVPNFYFWNGSSWVLFA
jgi:hypothetical protein